MANREDDARLFNIEDLMKEAWAPKPVPPLPTPTRQTRLATGLSQEERRDLSFSLTTYIQRCRSGKSQFD